MSQKKCKSFAFKTPHQIEQANVVENLISQTNNANHVKFGVETWACAWAPDNSYFAWTCGQGILQLIPWNSKLQKCQDSNDSEGLDGRSYHVVDCAEIIWSLAFGSGLSSTNRHFWLDENCIVATGLASGKIKLWNCHKGTLIFELLDHRDTVRCLDFTKNGTLQLVSASKDGTIKLWDLNNEGNMYSTFKSLTMFYGCCFSLNGHFIAAVGNNGSVYLWKGNKLDNNLKKLDVDGHRNDVVSCVFSPDSALLATASYDTKVIVWDTLSMKKLQTFGHLHPSPSLIFAGGANDHYVRGLSFNRNGLTLGTVCDDGYARFWSLEDSSDPLAIGQATDALSCQFSPDGSVLAVGFRSGNVNFYAASTPVPSLLQLSRQSVRKHMTSDDFHKLPIPILLITYVQYHHFLQ